MSKSNTKSDLQENTDQKIAPTSVMLTTLFLLIGVLVLTSILLIQYTSREDPENQKSISSVTKNWFTPNQKNPQTNTVVAIPEAVPVNAHKKENKGFSFKALFPKKTNSARWPRLNLTGFGDPSTGKIGFAIINGKYLIEGNMVGKVKVRKILKHGVEVEYKGETKVIFVESD